MSDRRQNGETWLDWAQRSKAATDAEITLSQDRAAWEGWAGCRWPGGGYLDTLKAQSARLAREIEQATR